MTLAAGAGALALNARLARADDAPAGKKLGFALVGIGRLTIGQLLPAFASCKSCRPVALVSGHADKARHFAQQYGIKESSIYNYQNYDNLKDNPEVDIVYVVLPNSMHAEYTIRAAKAGKHVLCEKPMATSSEDCRQMIDACKAAGKKLMIAYRLHYEPYNQKAIQICREKTYGNLKLIQAEFGFNMPDGTWRTDKKLAGGGPLPDVGVYCINATRYLSGADPIEVCAQLCQPKDDPRFQSVEESAVWWTRFPGEVLATCQTSYGTSLGSRYRFTTRDAQVTLDPAYNYHGITMAVRDKGKQELVKLPDVDQFAAEMDDFAQCVMNDKESRTPGAEGLADVKVLEAIYKSASDGGKPVKV
jgi:predicted dehydrogenase